MLNTSYRRGVRGLLLVVFGWFLGGGLNAADPMDPAVQRLSMTLKQAAGLTDDGQIEGQFKELRTRVEELKTLQELVRGALLSEWQPELTVSEKWKAARDSLHQELLNLVVRELAENLKRPNPPLQIALLGLVRSESEQSLKVATTTQSTLWMREILRKLWDGVAVAASDSCNDVQVTALMTLAYLTGKPDKTAEVYRKVLQSEKLELRRVVGEALQVVVVLTTERLKEMSLPERVEILEPVLPVIALSLKDSDFLVRRRGANALIKATRYLGNLTTALNIEEAQWRAIFRPLIAPLSDLLPTIQLAAHDSDPVVRALVVGSLEHIAGIRRILEGEKKEPAELPEPRQKEPDRKEVRLVPPVSSAPPALIATNRMAVSPSPTANPSVVRVIYLVQPTQPEPQLPAPTVIQAEERKPEPKPEEKGPNEGEPREAPPSLKPLIQGSLPTLQRALKDPNIRVRLFALDSLEGMGDDAAPLIPDIVEALGDPDRFVKWSASRVLRGLAPMQARLVVPALGKLLCHPDVGLRIAVINALTAYKKEALSTLPQLSELLLRSDLDVRTEVLTLIGTFGELGLPALPALVENLRYPDPRVRLRAAEILGGLGPQASRANAALFPLLQDEDAGVRRAASQALYRINPAPEINSRKEDKELPVPRKEK